MPIIKKNGTFFASYAPGVTTEELSASPNFLLLDPQTRSIRQVVNPHPTQNGLADERYSGANSAITNYGNQDNVSNQRQESGTSITWQSDIDTQAAYEKARGFRDNNGSIEFKATDATEAWTSFANISGGGAPADSKYLVTQADSSLTNERVIYPESGVAYNDNGSLYKLSFDANSLNAVGQTLATDDYVVVYDTDAGQSKKALVSNLPFTNNLGDITSVGVSGTGLSGGGNTGAVTVTISPDTVAGGFSSGAVANAAVNGLATVATTGNYSDLSGTPTVPTNNNQLTNGAGYTTNVGTCTSVGISAGNLIDVSSSPVTTSGTITVNVDLSELTDGTGAISGAEDEMVYLDNGAQKRKQIDEINLGQFNNDQSWTSNTGTVTASSTDSFTNKTFNVSATGNSLTNVPNGSLTNDGVTINTGTGLSGGGDVSLGGSLSLTNSGVTQITAGSGISINSGTGNVTVSSSLPVVRSISGKTALAQGGSTTSDIDFSTEISSNSSVVSNYTDGTFTLASTGTYKINVTIALEMGLSGNGATGVFVQLVSVDGSNTTTPAISSSITTLSSSARRLLLSNVYVSYTNANTRTVKLQVKATANESDIYTSIDLGSPTAIIEITKIS